MRSLVKAWTPEDERDPFAKFHKRDPLEIPGPIDRHHASHWCVENEEARTIETWVKTGPDYRFELRQRVRPMTESEIILLKVRDHSRDAVLKALGVNLQDLLRKPPPPKKPWWKFMR